MNDILNYSNNLVSYFLNDKINSNIIIILLLILIIYIIINEPSNTIILLFYNKYYHVLLLLLIFFITLHNPIIGTLLALHYLVIMNKLLSFKLKTETMHGGRRKNSEYYIKRDALSYFLK